jgi:hypothetical protein
MKSKCCFDLHLFYNQGSWTLLHVSTFWQFLPLPFENSLFNSCVYFFTGVLILWGLSFFFEFPLDSGYYPLPDEYLAKIFSHSVGCLLNLVTVSFAVQKLFSLRQSCLFVFSLRCWAFWVLFKMLFPVPICSSVFPTA